MRRTPRPIFKGWPAAILVGLMGGMFFASVAVAATPDTTELATLQDIFTKLGGSSTITAIFLWRFGSILVKKFEAFLGDSLSLVAGLPGQIKDVQQELKQLSTDVDVRIDRRFALAAREQNERDIEIAAQLAYFKGVIDGEKGVVKS